MIYHPKVELLDLFKDVASLTTQKGALIINI